MHLYFEGCVIICGYLWDARYLNRFELREVVHVLQDPIVENREGVCPLPLLPLGISLLLTPPHLLQQIKLWYMYVLDS